MKIASLLVSLLSGIVGVITPELRTMLSGDIAKWESTAKAHNNELEVVLVEALKALLSL